MGSVPHSPARMVIGGTHPTRNNLHQHPGMLMMPKQEREENQEQQEYSFCLYWSKKLMHYSDQNVSKQST